MRIRPGGGLLLHSPKRDHALHACRQWDNRSRPEPGSQTGSKHHCILGLCCRCASAPLYQREPVSSIDNPVPKRGPWLAMTRADYDTLSEGRGRPRSGYFHGDFGFHKRCRGPRDPRHRFARKRGQSPFCYRLSHGFMGKTGFVSAFSVGNTFLYLPPCSWVMMLRANLF